MINRLLITALGAGILAGLLVSVIQMTRVIPLILHAETYEVAESVQPHAHTHGDAHGDAHEEWAPNDGLERTLYTALTNVITGVGFALILGAAITLRGKHISLYDGALWGAAGFLCFSFLPALGLPPELPGTGAADVADRQLWWLMTAFSSVIGLALVVFAPNTPLKAVGVLALLTPHIIGAPHPEVYESTAPAALAAEFAVASLATSALFWGIIGLTSGWIHQRLESPSV